MPRTERVPDSVREQVIQYKKEHPEKGSREIGRKFGLHHKTINRALKAESSPVKVTPEMDEPTGQWAQGEKYVYNGDTDTYVNFLKCRPTPLVLSGTKFRSMKKGYSDWNGQPSTINEICRRFAMPRDQFLELKALHGWTHEAEPFSREEVLGRGVEDLAEDAFQQKRQALWEEFEKKKWHQTRRDAERWNNLEQSFILPLQEKITELLPAYEAPRLNIRAGRNPFAVVTSAGELHYGGHGWVFETGETFGRKEAADRLTFSRQRMIEEVAERGRPEVIYYAAGHDYFNCDTDNTTTTKGTPQEMDGTAAQALAEGLDLAAQDIDILRSVAPVTVVSVPGNHDRLLTVALVKFLEAWSRRDSDVNVHFSAKSRAYESYGKTCLGFLHGDGAVRPNQYVATMLTERPDMCASTIYRAFFSGHLHSEVVRELVGGKHFQMASLRGRDKFHERNAYLSEAALCSYIVDKDTGVKSTIFTHVN